MRNVASGQITVRVRVEARAKRSRSELAHALVGESVSQQRLERDGIAVDLGVGGEREKARKFEEEAGDERTRSVEEKISGLTPPPKKKVKIDERACALHTRFCLPHPTTPYHGGLPFQISRNFPPRVSAAYLFLAPTPWPPEVGAEHVAAEALARDLGLRLERLVSDHREHFLGRAA